MHRKVMFRFALSFLVLTALSDASYVATKVDCNPKKTPQKITDYFSTSALEDLKDWEADDSFGLDVDGDYNNSLGETGAPGTKKAKLDVRTN